MFTKRLLLCAGFLTALAMGSNDTAEAGYTHGYSSWNYHPTRSYYYSRYTYTPVTTVTTTTRYHYCVHVPSRPRYVYYYNPVRRVYWGRYDIEAKGYSMLKEEDRKDKLEDIPESAFPEPGEMPDAPDSDGTAKLKRPDLSKLPKAEAAKDAP